MSGIRCIYRAALALVVFLRKPSKATIYSHRTGENMRTGSRSSNSRCPHAARSRYSPPVCHDSIPGHQVSYQRFWENRWIPDSLPTGQRPRRKPPHVDTTLIKVKRRLPSMSFFESHRRQQSITRSARLNKQRSGDFRLSPPANFANSAILPTDKISAFFMQNFLLQKPKDSSWLCPSVPTGEE